MASTALKLALAWAPFYVLWTLFVVINSDASLLVAARSGLNGIGTAALLGIGVWWATGRFPWPARVELPFYGLHAALGTAYGMTWVGGGELLAAWMWGERVTGRFWEWEDFGWRLLMGLWLYGLVAGVSYAIRTRRRLRDQERAAARLEALATEARLRSLQVRLNPHFLFNALNSVSALIATDPDAAEGAVERLGDLLRYSLAEADGPVLLEREWAFTRDYLEMEGLRLGDRLRVEADVRPEALAVRVPPFALQILVENAVRHAAAPREEGADVRISARVEEGRLVLSVADDGPGTRPDGIAGGDGTGLKNLRERLAGLYGGEAHLTVETAPARGFTATVRVPLGRGTAAAEDGAPGDRA